MSDHKIEIDVTLNTNGVSRDFDALEQAARSGVRSVVRAVDQMAEAMNETGTEAQRAGQDYSRASDEMRQSATQAAEETEELSETVQEAERSTESFEESLGGLSEESQNAERAQRQLGDQTEQTRQNVEKSGKSFEAWGDLAKTALTGVVAAAGAFYAAMAAGAGVSVKFGTEYRQASNTIQAATGATQEEMEALKEVMGNVYANNFGEDMNDVAEAVANVKKSLGGTDEEIQKATEAAFAFRDTFGYEVPESTRAASAIMKNFGGDAEHAYDLMAMGAQKGLDFSGELLDSIDEYSVQFAKSGLTAEQMFNILASGYEAGAWNLDKIGDAVKELNVRLVDGSDTTKEGLKAIGLNADEVAQKMSQGGETATEAYKQVVRGLAEMDDKQAQNIAGVNLFGTMWEDLGPDVVAQLATMEGAYDDVSGTMDKINEVKYDDAASALEALKRKAEVSILQPISESIMPAISDATNAAVGYIDRLANAYESEGIGGLVQEAANIFVDIADSAAEQAPRMIEVAVGYIEQMVQGFSENKGRLVKAGDDLIRSLAGAAVKLLPSELQKPVKEAVDDIIDSITGGGIKNGLNTFQRLLQNGFKAVTTVTKTVLPPFVKAVDKVADNLDILVPLVVAGATAFKGYAIVTSITKGLGTMSATVAVLTAMEEANALQIAASTGALTLKQMAVGVLTGKITLATAAHAAWNAVMNANPIGLVITGIVALGAAIAAHTLLTDDAAEKTVKLSTEEQALKDRVNEQKQAYDELAQTREEQFGKIQTEYANTQILADELKGIVDENGKIKEGYEDRANVITGLLAEALGIEIEITDGVIQKYDELKKSIDQVILTKKAEAVQEANKELYTEAINNQTEAYKNYADAQNNAKKTADELKAAQDELQKIQDKIDTSTSREEFTRYGNELRKAKNKVSELEQKQKDQNETLSDAEEQYVKYVSTIENYEGVAGAIASGDADQINEAVLRATNSFITAESGTKESLERQVQNMTDNYEALKEAVEIGAPGVTQKSVDEAAVMVAQAKAEYAKFAPEAAAEIGKLDPEITSTLVEMDLGGKLGNEGKEALNSMISGMLSKTIDVTNTGIQIAQTASTAVGTIKNNKVGAEFSNTFGDGIVSKTKSVANTALGVAVAARTSAGTVSMIATGAGFGDQYASGIDSKKGTSRASGSTIATAAKVAAGAVNAIATGEQLGNQYTSGVESKDRSARSAGEKLGNSAKDGAGSVSAYGTGQDFGSGFCNGISSMVGNIVEAGYNFALAGLNAAKRAIDSHSPSKETDKLGGYFGEGFVNGVLRLTGKAIQTAGMMGKKSVQAFRENLNLGNIDFGAEMQKAYDAVNYRNYEVVSDTLLHVAYEQSKLPDREEGKKSENRDATINQTVNINQPVKTPIEMSRELKRAGKELAFG